MLSGIQDIDTCTISCVLGVLQGISIRML